MARVGLLPLLYMWNKEPQLVICVLQLLPLRIDRCVLLRYVCVVSFRDGTYALNFIVNNITNEDFKAHTITFPRLLPIRVEEFSDWLERNIEFSQLLLFKHVSQASPIILLTWSILFFWIVWLAFRAFRDCRFAINVHLWFWFVIILLQQANKI